MDDIILRSQGNIRLCLLNSCGLLTGYHGNRAAMTTNFNLPFNSACIIQHFGVFLVFLPLMMRTILRENCKFNENVTFDWLPWQQSNHDNQFEPSIQQCLHCVSLWCIPCLSIPYGEKDMTLKLLISSKILQRFKQHCFPLQSPFTKSRPFISSHITSIPFLFVFVFVRSPLNPHFKTFSIVIVLLI